jgi:hypothetical protein
MNSAEFQLRGISDPRLAAHATSPLPAWLWSIDGTRILWANPVGAKVFDAANSATLADKVFGPANSYRRQVAQLAGRLLATGAIGCAASATTSACSLPAPARGWISPMAIMAF